MKLKADLPRNTPESLTAACNRLRPIVSQRVLVVHLHAVDYGPAEFYVQECDFADADTHSPFCEARLTGVSLNDERSKNDFLRARDELEQIYVGLIQASLEHDEDPPYQLMASIGLDAPLPATNSSWVESEALYVAKNWVKKKSCMKL